VAFELERGRLAGAEISYQLFETSQRLGGVLSTERHKDADFVIELGAEAWLSEKPAARELCRDLGIEDQLIGSNDAQRRTYILANQRLAALPEGIFFVVPASKSAAEWELFSAATQKKIAEERNFKPHHAENDESVAGFVERHFGAEAVDWLADPMLAGIYGGAAERLSARAVLPRMVEIERKQGSLIRALAGTMPRSSQPLFSTLRDGMQSLVEKLVASLDRRRVFINQSVQTISSIGNGWKLKTTGAVFEFDSIVCALPAYAAAELLQSEAPQLARELVGIEYSSSAVVALAYRHQQPLPSGFGFLVPRNQKRRLMACTFVHQKFSGRAPAGAMLLRAFFGGVRDPEVLELSDDELASLAQAELQSILKLTSKPAFTRVQRWPRSMPQYNVGHLERVARIEKLAAALPGLKLAGSAYHGVGIPDCIHRGREAARNLLTTHARSTPAQSSNFA
jgi:oxygen-dependent protoporphyrinogen oxidase